MIPKSTTNLIISIIIINIFPIVHVEFVIYFIIINTFDEIKIIICCKYCLVITNRNCLMSITSVSYFIPPISIHTSNIYFIIYINVSNGSV
ncbi:hypothetical protein GLOIN_2v1541719 [Rhizophagus irregularis DAOM 181602=DAOM 197198]|uniref:Uncharacterized protein n=1 Tax=Rhizophagus irregularis (strain DAOM 181602 / DAOM 197198 / MUCL 43194) TaxID=747089 RepID=A0A2P4QK79_RHIID|nr:hypothetical protein GLOIN_2v1541719 [Rhizophagus irregularis DAOM 181602=DAOM 197198]POG78062.1 hypothetical protein GLOIN_2v1541719 [Rhizophagus irregularis DAOM 181602=DAOM 197198]|eukprot:XP_025184928.1 hypothetical protein GLOIN_2v1541719 [Rhizophagus irregularis DAOM 181602=DAOM 197198]